MSLVFGPVSSRRLGRSLGVDLFPFKTCTYDCIYCQLGATTKKICERKSWVRAEDVIRELEERLDTLPDYITFSGSGEPTLHEKIGEIIRRIKSVSDAPVAVLTNGSLLYRPEVREDLMEADVVMPSLDVCDGLLYRHINRPHPDLNFENTVEGLRLFRKEFKGEIRLSVMFLSGMNAIAAEAERIARLYASIDPDRIYLNTPIRPPVEEFAMQVPKKELTRLAGFFGPKAEIVGEAGSSRNSNPGPVEPQRILDLIRRRPCSIEEIAFGLGMLSEEVADAVEILVREGIVQRRRFENRFFLTIDSAP